MTTHIKASLEKHILEWIETNADAGAFDWEHYWYDANLGARMAAAAYGVFMAAREAQDFAKAQER